jgi:hypothetical protein
MAKSRQRKLDFRPPWPPADCRLPPLAVLLEIDRQAEQRVTGTAADAAAANVANVVGQQAGRHVGS